MERMIRFGLVAAIAALGSSAHANEGFCAEIEEVVAAARETPPFSSFPAYSRRIGQLGFYDCQTDNAGGNPQLLCSGYPTGPHGWSGRDDEMVSWIEQCLPHAVRSEEVLDARGGRPGADHAPRQIGMHEFHNTHLDVATLRFTITREIHSRYTRVTLTAYNRGNESEPATSD